jgi:hypothetical protein
MNSFSDLLSSVFLPPHVQESKRRFKQRLDQQSSFYDSVPIVKPPVVPIVAPVEPVVTPAAEPVVTPAAEPVVESVAQPAAPVVESVAQPAAAPVVESVAQPAAAPVVESVAQPAAPVVESVVEPVAAPVVESVVEPVAQPADEPTVESAAEPAAEPVKSNTIKNYQIKSSLLIKKDIVIINKNMTQNQVVLEHLLNKLSSSKCDYSKIVCVLTRKYYKSTYTSIVKDNSHLNFEAFKIKDTFKPLEKTLLEQREYDTRNLCILDYDLIDEHVYDFMFESDIRPHNTQFIVVCDRYPTTLLSNLDDFVDPFVISSRNDPKNFYKKIVQELVTKPVPLETFLDYMSDGDTDVKYLIVNRKELFVN